MRLSTLFTLIFLSLFACSSNKQEEKQGSASTPSLPDDFTQPPRWAQEVVWYQIFVERFRNGDPSNDPRKVDIKGTYPGYIPPTWELSAWTQDWYQEDAYFSELEGKSDFLGNPIQSFGQKAQLRRYGGDLQGVLDQLDYLDSLGVSAIYFNPLNDAPSMHKYDARHWRHIDRNFGPSPEEDVKIMAQENPEDPETWQMTGADQMFIQVIEALHARGIKVILDYSWNHTGHTFWAWEDIKLKGEQSKYKDWYWVEQFDDPETPEDEFKYRGWFGVFDLPEVKESKLVDHRKKVEAFEGNLVSEGLKEHIFAVSRRWLDPDGDGDPSDGVDGYRLDVAAELPLGFWREYREIVRALNPEAYLLGEVWWEEWPDKLMDPALYLKGDIFDATMNYRWYRSARHFFNAAPEKISVKEFTRQLKSLSQNLRPESNYAMMNLCASHDAPRVLTSLFNKNKYKYNSSVFADPEYKIHSPDAPTYATLKMLLVHQFTYIGAPHIWAGDEMGMWGGDDPSNRKPLIWPDFTFQVEKAHPLGLPREASPIAFNTELFKFYQTLIRIRQDQPALQKGEIDFIITDDEKEILVYRRWLGNEEVFIVFNLKDEAQRLTIPVSENKSYQEILYKLELKQKEQNLELLIPAQQGLIILGN